MVSQRRLPAADDRVAQSSGSWSGNAGLSGIRLRSSNQAPRSIKRHRSLQKGRQGLSGLQLTSVLQVGHATFGLLSRVSFEGLYVI